MSLIGIINSDPDIERQILEQFESSNGENWSLHIARRTEEIREMINFDLPEIVIVNISDTEISYNNLRQDILSDIWLHNFAIIALYDGHTLDAQAAAEALKDFNALAFIEFVRISRDMLRYVEIINANQQVIVQYDLASKLSSNISGSFQIPNDILTVPVYTNLATSVLFQHRFIDPDRKIQLQLVLQELLINSIEHGNCNISYEEKSQYLLNGGDIAQLILEKNRDSEISARRVLIEWDINPDKTTFVITDEGNGFDVLKYRESFKAENERMNGRGIIIAKSLVRKLSYNRKGNRVSFEVAHDRAIPHDTPQGFSEEEVLLPKAGDIIFREGDESDFLYYISSGTYAATLGNRRVGTIVPGDIFMGEMAFLLNNKRSVTVTAISAGKLVRVSRKSFVNVIRNYPHYGIFLAKLLARKLARANVENAGDSTV